MSVALPILDIISKPSRDVPTVRANARIRGLIPASAAKLMFQLYDGIFRWCVNFSVIASMLDETFDPGCEEG
jgi:hypothetical protein